MIRIVLPEATPSLNQLLRMHWAKRRRMAKGAALAIRMQTLAAPVASEKRRVRIERHGKKTLDEDNAYGGCKLVIDCLKDLDLLVDDSPRWLELEVTQSRCAKGEAPQTIITLENA